MSATGCPACGRPGTALDTPLVKVCVNPECMVFSWTTNPRSKAIAIARLAAPEGGS